MGADKIKFYHDEPLFGLDIGHSSLKAMQIDTGAGKRPVVLGYGVANFNSAAIENGVITKPEIIANAMHELFEKDLVGKITSQRVACSLPTSRTFSRPMSIPAIDSREIIEAVHLEAEQYIPIPLTNLYLDYEILRQDQQNTEVLLVAASKNIVDSYFKVLELLNLQPVAFEPTMNAAARLVQRQGQLSSQPTILVDIGSITTDIAVFDKSLLVASTVNSGSDNLAQQVSKNMRLSPKQARDLVDQYGIAYSEKQQRIIDSIRPSLDNLVREIQKSVRFYSERGAKSGGKITQVVTLGGGSIMPGLNQFLSKELRLPVHHLEPWDDIGFGSLVPPNDLERSVYITAAGEAILNPVEVLS
jgi:type IV pilus assembly protein PilM